MVARVEIEDLRSLILKRLESLFPSEYSNRIADIVLFGEMAGRPSHGIIRLLPGSYGVMDEATTPVPEVHPIGPLAARVEGKQGMLVASVATDVALDLAGDSGFAVVTVRGSRSTSGSLAYFVEKLANAGLVAFVSAGTPDFVSPPGGKGRVLGTNPLAYGIPTMEQPFILDMATSAISGGDVLTAAATRSELPPGVAIDESGDGTIDPADVLGGGAVLPFGGHKGLGLSMTVEILNKALTGATGDPGDWGHLIVAFAISLLGDEMEIRQRAQAEIERMRSAGARIPGHRTLAKRDEALERGWVDVDDDAYERLLKAAG